ncbi:hypothetical protein FACS1894211_04460 [Clostridia bacterium]|nr:hypothetical protein FACS1894211_04460 [Clostridia bacterium]
MDYEMEHWVRLVLNSTMSLTKNVGILDKQIEFLVFNHTDTQNSIDSVIDLMERKRRVVALRTVVTDMLSSLAPRRREVLVGRYIFEKTCAAVALDTGLNLRYYFKVHDEAIRECAGFLYERGLSPQWFEHYYGDEDWIVDSLSVARRERYMPCGAVGAEQAYAS